MNVVCAMAQDIIRKKLVQRVMVLVTLTTTRMNNWMIYMVTN